MAARAHCDTAGRQARAENRDDSSTPADLHGEEPARPVSHYRQHPHCRHVRSSWAEREPDPTPPTPGLLFGSTWSFQALDRDVAAGGTGFNSSDAIAVTTGL